MTGDIENGGSVNSISSNHISVSSIDRGNVLVDQCINQYDVNVLNTNNVTSVPTSVLSVNSDRSNEEVESVISRYNTAYNNTLYNMSDGKHNNAVCFQCDRSGTFPQGGGVLHSQNCQPISYNQGYPAYCDKVDFLCTDVSKHCIGLGALVFLHGCNGNQGRRGFYYLTDDGSLVECKALPSGILQVTYSTNLYIVFSKPVGTVDEEMRLKAKIAYENHCKDLYYQSAFKKSYDQYLDQVIQDLIHTQDCIIEESCPAPESGFVIHVTNTHTKTSADVIADFDAHVDRQALPNTKVNKDFLIPNKTRGFLNHQGADFEFIGPDRAPVSINSVQKCLEVANIIRDTGFPNYRVARIPLVSDLVIKAWEYHLSDYPDKILINYLKFGFPLSINDHSKLANTNINNHASAMHFPNAIAEYIAKEKACGAMLGPVDMVNSPHYHCSPILTRPKDDIKRRVIVNLSYPPGQSLNDQVTRDMFDNRPFTLKFPKIEDIVDQILVTEDPMLFKIDVARAFRNLRADPVDAVKLGICWADKWYIDPAIAFGWASGTSVFQMVADAISFIMAKENCKIFAYVDDFIGVAPRAVAAAHFQRLSDLLTELGLPMNPQKKTPPCRSLTCLGITINIQSATLQIEKSKLQAIHEACLHISHKKFLSKKTF